MSHLPNVPPEVRGTRCAWPAPKPSGLRSIDDPDPIALHLTFQVTATYQFTYAVKRGGMTEILSIPPGVELIGECFPGEADQETILFRDWNYIWRIPRSDVQISPWQDSVVAAQRTMASARQKLAEQAMQREDYPMSERLYAQVGVELVAADASFRTIGQARMERAIALILTEADDEQINAQLEQAASAYEWAFSARETKMAGEHIAVADEASQVQVYLAQQYMALEEDAKALACIEQILAWNKRITKRYPRKVELLLLAADLLFKLGESARASAVLKTADRFFQQQVVMHTSYDEQAARVGRHLNELKANEHPSAQPFICTLTADTPDDLEALLSALRGAGIDGLTLPTTMSRVPKGASPRHGVVYAAKLRYKPNGER
jgi:tetratricopeptide (TPR) repeat protein